MGGEKMKWDEYISFLRQYVSVITIEPEMHLLEDLDLDSFQIMELIFELEEQGCVLNSCAVENTVTVKDFFLLMGGELSSI